MPRHRMWRVPASIAVALALAAGCSDSTEGSDSSEDGGVTTTSPPTSTVQATTTTTPIAAADRDYEVVADHDSVAGASLYRPADLGEVAQPMPVVVTGVMSNCTEVANPGLATSVEAFHKPVGAAGFLLLAVGTRSDEVCAGQYFAASCQPGPVWDRWKAALDAVAALNDDPESPYHGMIDMDRVGAWGTSCGGWVASNLAVVDERVRSLLNYTGCDFGDALTGAPGPMGDALGSDVAGELLSHLAEQLPVAWYTGGPEDFTQACVLADFERAPSTMPAFLARHESLKHEEMGAALDPALLVNWFDFTLNGNEQAGSYFFGVPFGPCLDTADPCPWTTDSKNWT
jgi:hypothetical protein